MGTSLVEAIRDLAKGRGRLWAFLGLFLLASAAAVNLQRMVDPDLFWHLRAGRDILDSGRAVLPDSWTYLFEGRPWVNQQWLCQVVMVKLFEWWGYWGLILFKDMAAIGSVLFILAALKGRPPFVRYATAALFVATTARFFLFRTHVLSFLCMAALVFLLERLSPKARLFWLPVLFALWANLHGLFPFGLWVLGSYTLVWWAQAGFRLNSDAMARWLAVPLSCAATLLNPFTWRVWETFLMSSGQQELTEVTEMWPVWKYPFLTNLGFFTLILLTLFLAILFPKAIHWPSLAACSLLLLLAMLHVRFTSDLTIPLLPLVAGLLNGAYQWALEKRPAAWWRRALPPVCAAMIAFTAWGLSNMASNPIVTPSRVPRQDYPVLAVEFMKNQRISGKVFNEYDWGGYVVWKLHDSRIYIDGRTATLLFPQGHVKQWKDTVDLHPGWRERLERGDPELVLLYSDDFITQELASDPKWNLLYRDDLAVLFGRR